MRRVTGSARVYWDDALTRYDFGPNHPMNPIRLDLLMRLADDVKELGHVEASPVLDGRNMTMVLAPEKNVGREVGAA